MTPEITVQIVHLDGPRKGEIDEVSAERITIGRDPQCNVVFPKDLRIISRLHAEIVREGNRFLFVRRGSNPCFMNGQPLEQAYLKQGDVISLAEGGPKISFLSTMGRTARSAFTAPPPAARSYAPPPPPLVATPRQYAPPPPPVMSARVAPENAPFTLQYGVRVRSLKQASVKIGRNERSDFVIQHPEVMDVHAEIFFAQNQYYLRDLSNSRATLLNDRILQADTPLHENDTVQFGRAGPKLRFLGTGRFVEVAEPVKEESEYALETADNDAVASHQDFQSRNKPSKMDFIKSLFKGK